MQPLTGKSAKFRLSRLTPLILALPIAACSPSFEEGIYAAGTGSGPTYEFGAEGQGRLTGAVPGSPTFTYEVESDQVVVSYEGGQPQAFFKRIDSTTLERQDGTRLLLRE